jgi:hypothetical protein
MYFRKYQFPSEECFNEIVQTIPEDSRQTIARLTWVISDNYCVDILWENEIPVDLIEYEIWDIEGNGSHTFLGWEFGNDTNSKSLFENHSKVITKEEQHLHQK